jgi:hypothetical protein
MSLRKCLPLVVAFVLGVFVCTLTVHIADTPSHAADAPAVVAPKTPAVADDLAALKAEVARLKGMVPDQSHAMSDVGYHYTNLYFAARAGNWPLAQFYADETRSHLKWAVRIIPLRKDRDGREVDLVGILSALEQSSLKDLDQAVKSKDPQRFEAAYEQQLENCMACHKAASKEFIRLHVPERPDAGVVEFRPEGAEGK